MGRCTEWAFTDNYCTLEDTTQLTSFRKDGGVDIIAEKGESGKKEKVIIQCKRYNKKVGVNPIRELLWAC